MIKQIQLYLGYVAVQFLQEIEKICTVLTSMPHLVVVVDEYSCDPSFERTVSYDID